MLVHMSFIFLKKLLNSDAIRNFFKLLKNIATTPTITTYLLIVPKKTINFVVGNMKA